MNSNFIEVGPQMGWQCPVCKAINAPWKPTCDCKGVVPSATTANAPTTDETEQGQVWYTIRD